MSHCVNQGRYNPSFMLKNFLKSLLLSQFAGNCCCQTGQMLTYLCSYQRFCSPPGETKDHCMLQTVIVPSWQFYCHPCQISHRQNICIWIHHCTHGLCSSLPLNNVWILLTRFQGTGVPLWHSLIPKFKKWLDTDIKMLNISRNIQMK